MADPHLLLFDLYHGGHHAQYLCTTAERWRARGLPGRLTIVVPPDALDRHPELDALRAIPGVALTPLEAPVPTLPGMNVRELLHNERMHAVHFGAALRRHRPSHALLMYLDDAQLALGFGLRTEFPVQIGGILFRSRFHYGAAFGVPAETASERLRRLRQQAMLWTALRNPRLRRVFCLDPYAAPYVDRLAGRPAAVALPDGIPPAALDTGDLDARARIRTRLGVDPDRRLLLLFGSLAGRKGTHEALAAVRRLAPADAARTALALVGAVPPGERNALGAAIEYARGGEAQIVLHDAFVEDAAVQDHFRAADLALLPYQGHVGSSGVLLRAAAAGVPVVASDFGLVGAYVRHRRLGAAVDAADPDALARAFAAFLAGGAAALGYDADAARAFAWAHTADVMADTMFEHLGLGAASHA